MAPSLTTAWPVGNDLRKWLTQNQVSAPVDAQLIDECVADATAKVWEKMAAVGKEPADGDPCPRTVHRAIVLESARLLYRRMSPHGAVQFGDVAIRLRSVDVDVEDLLGDRVRLGPVP